MHFEAVTATLELVAERADKLSVRIENENGRVVLLVFVALVDHVQVACFVEGHVVCRLPRVLLRQLWPVVQRFVLVLTAAENDGGIGLLGGKNGRQSCRCRSTGGHF